LSRLYFLQRVLQLLGTIGRQVCRAAWRFILRQPLRTPQLLREALQALGGAFVKFGQGLSLQVDLLPREYCNELLNLLDSMPPIAPAAVEHVLRSELGASPQELFREFDYAPIASASIGQVHCGTLKDGTQVAIKVQRPEIDQVFERDIQLLRNVVKLIEFLRLRRFYIFRESITENTAWTHDELDYRCEAAYCQFLGKNAAGATEERIPKIFWELTTARVLTAEYLNGPSLAQYLRMVEENNETAMADLRAKGFDPSAFMSNVVTNFFRDAFRFGAFHADPHPANVLILPGNVVGYVDFGIVAFLSQDARRRLAQWVLAYSQGDISGLFEAHMGISVQEEEADLPTMRRRLEEIAPGWYHQPAYGKVRFRVTFTAALLDFLTLGRKYGVSLRREIVRYLRSSLLVDGLVARIAPGLEIADLLRHAVEDYELEQARRAISSPAATLSILTDVVLWLESGPGGLVRWLRAHASNQPAAPVSETNVGDPAARWQARTLGVSAVWVVILLAFGLWGCFPPWSTSPFLAGFAVAFVLIWTASLVRLLRRMVADK
jgi:ubiquinone biosynthesis protein